MVAAFAAKNGLGVDSFWQSHSVIVGLLLPSAEVPKILSCKTSWIEVADPLMLVCASSKVGAKMFAFAKALVAADRIASFCIEALAALEPPSRRCKRHRVRPLSWRR